MPPFFSKETRQTFALIATGIHQSLDFYADLRDTKTCQNPTDTSGTTQDEGTEVMDLDGSNENYTDGSNEDYTHGSNEGYYCNSDHESTGSNENTEILAGYRASLSSITEDMLMRIETGGHSIISAVSKFIQRYSRLKDSHAPSPAIADALHMFGKTSSKFICIPLCVVLVRFHLINPRRACAARVTVLSLCVCVCVCVCYLANSYAVNVRVQSKVRIESKCSLEAF